MAVYEIYPIINSWGWRGLRGAGMASATGEIERIRGDI